ELSSRGDIGYIVGASSTLEDYYYVYIDKLNNIGFQRDARTTTKEEVGLLMTKTGAKEGE
ncbi:MAG: hypothetical protein IIU65_03990, partial [Clostridia bacterium]|nr:hypothetical protein [Clostridia bacterium]